MQFTCVARDFDGNGFPDVVSVQTDSVRVLRNTTLPGDTLSFARFAFPGRLDVIDYYRKNLLGPEGVDLDGDGMLDLVVPCGNNELIAFYRNSGGQATPLFTCPNTGFVVNAAETAASYQWQSSTDGVTYTNLIDGAVYSGTTTSQLTVAGLPAAASGLYLRCLASGGAGKPWAVRFLNTFNGAANNLWSNPQNWSCGTVPDEKSGAVITADMQVDVDATVRTLTVLPGVRLQVNPEVKLTVLIP
jgi:hypothetical protein